MIYRATYGVERWKEIHSEIDRKREREYEAENKRKWWTIHELSRIKPAQNIFSQQSETKRIIEPLIAEFAFCVSSVWLCYENIYVLLYF